MIKQPGDGRFPTTHWTLIARLKSGDGRESDAALDEICAQYHYPLYCYIRWRGLDHHEAQDALHDFLARLLRLESLKEADEAKGRLRSYLATALQRYLINRHRDNQHRLREISLDQDVEERFRHEDFAVRLSPEFVLERTWAMTVLRAALNDLSTAQEAAGKGGLFRVLEPFLNPEGSPAEADYAAAALKLGISEATARQAVKRLREKFRQHLRQRIAETLSHPTTELIDEEIRALHAATLK